jgi:hypothetical protein
MAKLLKIKTGVDTTTDDIVVKKAKQLETARLINGVPFDGTQDIILEPGTSENADKVDGYHADTANVAETVVVRDTNKNINVTSVSADWFDLNTATEFLGIQETPGRIFFDETHDTLAIITNSGNKIEVGEDLFLPLAANKSGQTIPNGYLVMATGSQGDKINVARAVTNGTVEPDFIVGVATVDIVNDSENGRITTQGYVKGVNTSTWNVGTILYPDPLTPGWWTATRPLAPAIKTPYAMVIKSNHASGILLVRMSTATKLGQTDTNVEFTNLQDNDLLVYNSLVGIWENKQLEELGVTGGTSVTVAEAAPVEPINGSLWFDSNTGKLNIYYIDVDSSQWISINDFDQLQIENWNESYSWGNHSEAGYLKNNSNVSSNPPINPKSGDLWFDNVNAILNIYYVDVDGGQWISLNNLSQLNIENWDEAYSWGNHAEAGYIKTVPAAVLSITESDKTNWNSAFSWGDHSLVGYLNSSALGNLNNSIVPATDDAIDLGSSTKRFRDLYLTGNTLHLGNLHIKDNNGEIEFLKLHNGSLVSATIKNEIEIPFSRLTNKPTTLSAFGITDALTLGTHSNTAFRGDHGLLAYNHSQLNDGTNPHGTTFDNIASKPTTISGYGITDAVTNTRTINGFNLQSNIILTNDHIDIVSETITSSVTLNINNKNRILKVNSSSAITLSIPSNASVPFPINTEVAIIREGSGTVSIAPVSGVTLLSTDSKRKIKGQYSSAALLKTASDTWLLIGSIEV